MENNILNINEESVNFQPTGNFLESMVDLEKFVTGLVDKMETVTDRTNNLYEEYLELKEENKRLRLELELLREIS